MEHRIVDHVYGTTSDIFGLMRGNRDIKESHVNKLYKAAMKGAKFPPIIVDRKTLVILDGQHRYSVAKRMWAMGIKYELQYILVDATDSKTEEEVIEDVISRQNGLHWTTKDYVNSQIDRNHPDYPILDEFCAQHALLIKDGKKLYGAGAAFLTQTVCNVSKNLPRFKPRAVLDADIFYDQLEQVGMKLGVVEHLFRPAVIVAWIRFSSANLEDNSQFEEFLTKVKKAFKAPMGNKKEEWVNYFTKILES